MIKKYGAKKVRGAGLATKIENLKKRSVKIKILLTSTFLAVDKGTIELKDEFIED